MTTQKVCLGCGINKNITEDYYKAGSKCYMARCKPCQNSTRWNKLRTCGYKKKGFKDLDENVKIDIIKMIENKEKLVNIAKKYNISYHNIIMWKKRGSITL